MVVFLFLPWFSSAKEEEAGGGLRALGLKDERRAAIGGGRVIGSSGTATAGDLRSNGELERGGGDDGSNEDQLKVTFDVPGNF